MEALKSLLQRVLATVERHRMFTVGQRVAVAVSGGADSVCLLYILRELAGEWNLCLTLLHLDHQLRGHASKSRAGVVGGLAVRLGLRIVSRCATLPLSGNLEQAGRRARLAFFSEMIQSGAADRVALGHTRSDQAE